jgi:hypothetical protein
MGGELRGGEGKWGETGVFILEEERGLNVYLVYFFKCFGY